jgi:predicted nucleic acid-binding protein
MDEAQAIVLDLNVLLAATLRPEGSTASALLRLYLGGAKLHTPDYVKEEFQRVLDRIAEKKGLNPNILTPAFNAILDLAEEVESSEYRRLLKQAESLVFDPKDTPYVAVALHLRARYREVVILTYNKRDYRVGELERMGVRVLTPGEAAGRLL